MNTLDIDEKLKHVEGFLGAFPYDKIPKSRKKFYSMIVNTEPDSEPGDHWLVLVYRRGRFWFLDSFGRDYNNFTFSIAFQNTIRNYIAGRPHVFNRKLLQQFTSNACGFYACYFVHMFSKRSLPTNLVSNFTDNLKRNDMYVRDYVSKI